MFNLLLTLWQCLPASIRLYVYSASGNLKRAEGATAQQIFSCKAPIQPLYEEGCLRLPRGDSATSRLAARYHPCSFCARCSGEYFIMTALRGQPLGKVFSKMQPDEVARVRESLSEFVRQLRAIPNDAPGVVSSPHHYMPCCDVNRVDEFQFGPLAFHTYLVSRIPPQYQEEITKAADSVLRESMRNLIPSVLRTGTWICGTFLLRTAG